MKTLTYNEKIAKVAKHLIKELKTKKDDTIYIANRFSIVTKDNKKDTVFDYDGLNIGFGDLSKEGLASITCDISREIHKTIKLPKSVRTFTDIETDTHWGMWSHHDYDWVKKIVFITPCKEFNAINKKLTHLGCKEIPFSEWFGGSVFGKRSSYSMTDKTYFATDKNMCDKVLAYLKGKKKVSYEIVRDEEFENREYGERYETEWDGYLSYRLKFTDSNGRIHTI